MMAGALTAILDYEDKPHIEGEGGAGKLKEAFTHDRISFPYHIKIVTKMEYSRIER